MPINYRERRFQMDIRMRINSPRKDYISCQIRVSQNVQCVGYFLLLRIRMTATATAIIVTIAIAFIAMV
jgi:hypothetical protein